MVSVCFFCILSASRKNGWEQEDGTFWTCIQTKHTILKYSLNKQRFFVVLILPIGLDGGFHDYARTKNPWKSPYQWINPKNITSIYKSTSQGIMLRNWGEKEKKRAKNRGRVLLTKKVINRFFAGWLYGALKFVHHVKNPAIRNNILIFFCYFCHTT